MIEQKEIDPMLAGCIALLGYDKSGREVVHSVFSNFRNKWSLGKFYPMPDGYHSVVLNDLVGRLKAIGVIDLYSNVLMNDGGRRFVSDYVRDEYKKHPDVITEFSRDITLDISSLLN